MNCVVTNYLDYEIESVKDKNGQIFCHRSVKGQSAYDMEQLTKPLSQYLDYSGEHKVFYVYNAIEGNCSVISKIYYDYISYDEGDEYEQARYKFRINTSECGGNTGEVRLNYPVHLLFEKNRFGNFYVSGIDISNTSECENIASKSSNLSRNKSSYKESEASYSTEQYMSDNGYDPENDSPEDMYSID